MTDAATAPDFSAKMAVFADYCRETPLASSSDPAQALAWLAEQTPETWHGVAATWNYDHSVALLDWIVRQERCDKGTACSILFVEGPEFITVLDPDADEWRYYRPHWTLCQTIISMWPRYRSGVFEAAWSNKTLLSAIAHARDAGKPLAFEPPADLLAYSGVRRADPDFEAMDGRIRPSYAKWLAARGLDPRIWAP